MGKTFNSLTWVVWILNRVSKYLVRDGLREWGVLSLKSWMYPSCGSINLKSVLYQNWVTEFAKSAHHCCMIL